MKKRLSLKALALLLSTCTAMLTFAACTPGGDSSAAPTAGEDLGSGEAKWSELDTGNGWMLVTNEGGATLGYSKDSGVELLQVDGYAFKDLNRNGVLDPYEDWRLDDTTRATDLAGQLPVETIYGLMNHESLGSLETDGSMAYTFFGDSFDTYMEQGVRSVLSFATGFPATTQAIWNNSGQVIAESLDFGIPMNLTTNPNTMSGWAGNLALAATFDADLVAEVAVTQAKQYRSMGFSTLLGPQIDLATEPRWSRVSSTFGEDPALARDLTNATISGLQSTYDEAGNDLGWGGDSVVGMMKHYPGDGAAESGREAHGQYGAFNIYPGDSFETALIPFVDGGLELDSLTGQVASVMTSYSIAYTEDESLGELVGSAFSEYKVSLLRDTYGFDGLICSDWGVTEDLGAFMATPWGVEDLTQTERIYKLLKAGVDQIGGATDPDVAGAYQLLIDDMGEEAALERMQTSARRILTTYFQANLFENPYVDTADASALIEGADAVAASLDTQIKSVVMLKNEDNTVSAEANTGATVYIPLQQVDGEWSLPVKNANDYYEVVTDTVDGEGNVVRATAAELADCEYAIVFVNNPDTGSGYDSETETYIPISLQYGEYTATSSYVRDPSVAGYMTTVEVEGVYGVMTTVGQENRTYFGQSTVASNLSDLEGILYASENMPADAKVIVAVNASNAMIFSEFESTVDAILVGFEIDNDIFFEIISGNAEPSGLLPIQMPANMETVEKQDEDVPRDMDCYVDAAGNSYDFAFGLDWSGVINDARTAKYNVPALS